jgi:hypothetical protein
MKFKEADLCLLGACFIDFLSIPETEAGPPTHTRTHTSKRQ